MVNSVSAGPTISYPFQWISTALPNVNLATYSPKLTTRRGGAGEHPCDSPRRCSVYFVFDPSRSLPPPPLTELPRLLVNFLIKSSMSNCPACLMATLFIRALKSLVVPTCLMKSLYRARASFIRLSAAALAFGVLGRGFFGRAGLYSVSSG
jgi:hypothetical protein